MITVLLPWLQAGVSICTLIGLAYAFYKFTKKPEEDIAEKLTKLDVRVSDLEKSVNSNWELTRKHQTMIDDIQLCILYLLDFEVAYCAAHASKNGEDEIDTTDLDEARKIIRQRLKQ